MCVYLQHLDYGQNHLHQQASALNDRLSSIRQSLAVIDSSIEQVSVVSNHRIDSS